MGLLQQRTYLLEVGYSTNMKEEGKFRMRGCLKKLYIYNVLLGYIHYVGGFIMTILIRLK
jgi:hypothetical protein